MLFCEPKAFATTLEQLGSFHQEPSTKNLYSYLPGFKLAFTVQFPLESFLPNNPFVFQLLKVPTKLTFFAFGA